MDIKFKLEKADIKDAASVAEFNCLMAGETENKILDQHITLKGVKAVLKDPRKGFYIVARCSDRVIGQLMVTVEWSDWRNQYFWWIQSVFVLPEYRGQGVFSALYRHVRDEAAFRKDVAGLRLYVAESNRSARDVYESLGMSQSDYLLYETEF